MAEFNTTCIHTKVSGSIKQERGRAIPLPLVLSTKLLLPMKVDPFNHLSDVSTTAAPQADSNHLSSRTNSVDRQ
jgi:hypothetical protein